MPANDNPAPYAHWMLREIHEQPATLKATLDHYVTGTAFRPETTEAAALWLQNAASGIVVAASGSSRHAGLVGELLLEDLSGTPVDVEYASEYIYRSDRARNQAAVLVISQSGETVDTLAALRRANQATHPTLAITNVPDSTMAREANVSFPTLAGRERAIPATKSFTAQLLNLYLLSLLAAQNRNDLQADDVQRSLSDLQAFPALVAAQLPAWESSVQVVAQAWSTKKSFLFVGRGMHYAIAREGALKLKESSYLSAEGYPSGELKHGPNALISDATPLIMLATVDRQRPDSQERYEKVVQLMHDMRQQGAKILAIANEGDAVVEVLAEHTIFVSPCQEALLAISEVIPLQLFAYFMAVQNGIDVDHPRNLSKAVLAE